MALSLLGKTAIVTGAGSGICLEFARLLLHRGANVVFSDLTLRPGAQSTLDKYPSNAIFQKTDVTSWAQLEKTFEAAEKRFGPVDIVCPGAGVFEPPISNFWIPPGTGVSQDKPLKDRYLSIDVNLVHPIRMTQMAISHFLAAEPPVSRDNRKSIVITASIASESASLHFPMYHAAKHGAFAFIKSLAGLESHLGIRVTGVLPGLVKTPIWTDAPDKFKMLNLNADGPDPWLTPNDVARVMMALVAESDTSSISGLGARQGQIQGGTCLEVLPGIVRDVSFLNNPGPQRNDGAEKDAVVQTAELEAEIITSLKKGQWGKVPG